MHRICALRFDKMPLRIYVKSVLIILEFLKLQFGQCLWLWILILVMFTSSVKVTKIKISRLIKCNLPSFYSKVAVLATLRSSSSWEASSAVRRSSFCSSRSTAGPRLWSHPKKQSGHSTKWRRNSCEWVKLVNFQENSWNPYNLSKIWVKIYAIWKFLFL